jgi:hypothetical protein
MKKMLITVLITPFVPVAVIYAMSGMGMLDAQSVAQFWRYSLYVVVPLTLTLIGLPVLVPMLRHRFRRP